MDVDTGGRALDLQPWQVRAALAGSLTRVRLPVRPQPVFEADGGCWFPTRGAPRGLHYVNVLHLRLGLPQDFSPFGATQRLWVRERWAPLPARAVPGGWETLHGRDPDDDGADVAVRYAADGGTRYVSEADQGEWTWPKAARRGWCPPQQLPRWGSRLQLSLVELRLERLHAITEAEALASGLPNLPPDTYIDTEGTKHLFPRGMWFLDSSLPVPTPGGGPGWSMEALPPFQAWWDRLHGRSAPWASNPWVWVLHVVAVTPTATP